MPFDSLPETFDGGLDHVMGRGLDRLLCFLDDQEWTDFFRRLAPRTETRALTGYSRESVNGPASASLFSPVLTCCLLGQRASGLKAPLGG
jgi:hypothetical protein